MYSTNENQFVMERTTKRRKLNGISMFAIVFALFVLILGITAGLTYSGFQSTAESNGTLTFAINGHQGTLNLTNTKVSGYNSQDLTLAFTLASEDNYHTPIITSIAMGGAPLNPLNNDFKSGDIIVATYNAPTLTINRAEVTGMLQITATSIADTYTISYNANGGTGTMANSTPSYGTDVTLSANSFTRDGYTFAGWATSVGGDVVHGNSITVRDLGDTTLYAKWTANTYSILYNLNGGAYGANAPAIATYDTAITINAPTKADYTFYGWDITGMDTTSHTYGNNTSTATSLSGITATTFNNLRASAGTVTFTAVFYQPLKFSSASSFTLASNAGAITWKQSDGTTDGLIEYSTDTISWSTWNGTTINSSSSAPYALYLRGTGNTVITSNSLANNWVLTGSNISCSGNIESILDYSQVMAGTHPSMSDNCFKYLFFNCVALITAPTVPATTLNSYCYSNMFAGCTSLVVAPELPATTLTNGCYNCMFKNCTNLMVAPALPATTLGIGCYSEMFTGCTSLTTAPALPATTLASSCYSQMFTGCTSLTTAPALPATTLGSNCYTYMFSGCTNLTAAPALPATTLASSCYSEMFTDCTSLTTAPALPATTLGSNCYTYMFSGCTNLTTAPAVLPATTLEMYSYSYMFNGCTSLTTAPTLLATTLERYCCKYMFFGCTSLATAPELPATTLANECYYMMFSGCTSLISIPALPATTLADNCYGFMFQNCTSLTEVELGENVSNLYTYMFQGCTNLVSVTLLKPSAPIVTLSSANALPFSNSGFRVYVPNDLLATYKAGATWSTYASKIYAIPYYMVGNTGYMTLADAVAGASSGDTIYLKRDTDENNTTIIINKDITLTSSSGIKKITRVYFTVNTGGTLTISNITLQRGTNGAITINGGTLNMHSGATIADYGYSDGIDIFNRQRVLYNSISYGGAVFVNSGTFNMTGGTISGCVTYCGGGGVALFGGVFNMSGGEIHDCLTAGGEDGGGAVFLMEAKFNMTGGALYNNYSYATGGAVEVWDFGEFYMSGGTMYGNSASSSGGAVYLFGSDDPSKFYMTGGTIYNFTGTNSDQKNGVFINCGELYYQPSNANQIGFLDISSGNCYNSAGTSDWTGINNHTGSWDGTWDPSILNN